ncbi:MBL fold metallo-hydrolase [Alkaliphilus hydrothermalis]|uniref:L-ascorbate metabolism protein UlaG (Beta-lactamase superfamily) n=1 Tax=Alkaliphilus hydrothermalis TaxID=1482730 RepID=A0ABS2NN58_9FIRM|nr:MBL fold metallo-hydrolase [Alkaliphilus hydrothermalis]MBM7614384.1 L-ascorbate metabolism protein UlaG (beta-lactamase superfamily) [Alkaliphilus hydrothermalis]
MAKLEAKIHHLFHSGFAVETSNHFVIFDYYLDEVLEGQTRTLENGVITAELLKDKKNVLVLVTHNHRDHFNPVIFQWQDANPNISYIFADEIEIPSHIKNAYTLKVYESVAIEDKTLIKAYGTTDRGGSFMVEVDGLHIYHSGDLNWWNWKSFTEEQQIKEEEDFKFEVNKITEKVDIAFVPVDPRLEESFHLAGQYFAQVLQPKLLVPIHFGDQYHITKEFLDKMLCHSIPSALIQQRGQMIQFSKNLPHPACCRGKI